MLSISLMRLGAKKSPVYRIVVKEKRSKRDGAYMENVGTYNPTRDPAEVTMKMDRVQYWISQGAQPTATVDRLIKKQGRVEAAPAAEAALVSEGTRGSGIQAGTV